MRIVVPKEINDDNLIEYNIPESTDIAYSPTKYYAAGEYCIHEHFKYIALKGASVSNVPEYDPAVEYVASQIVSRASENKTYKALLGVASSQFAEWNSDSYYIAGAQCKIAALKKIYKCLLGENPNNYNEWSAATTYASGDYVKITATGKIYKSLLSNNLNKPPADNLTGISPYWSYAGVINTGMPPDMSVLFTEWSSTTAYAVGDKIKVTDAEAVFECLVANTNFYPVNNLSGATPKWKKIYDFVEYQSGDNPIWGAVDYINIGYEPEDNTEGTVPLWKEGDFLNYGLTPSTNISGDDPAWVKVGPTNAWSLFDGNIADRTVGIPYTDGTIGSSIKFAIKTTTSISCISLFDLFATRVSLTLKSPDGSTVWSSSTVLTSNMSRSWSDFFFGEKLYNAKNFFSVFPAVPGATLHVNIYSTTVCECGLCVVGKAKFAGLTLQGVKNSITDYSKKTTSEYGVTSLSVGAYAKNIVLDLDIENSTVDSIYEWVASLRATPLVFVTDNSDESNIQYQSLLVYGFYSDFSVTIPGPTYSTCSFEIQGLI